MASKPPKPFEPPAEWSIYKRQPGHVLGFHGCDSSVGADLLSGRLRHLKPSTNEYDWLGTGIYFWESDPWRAFQFAEEACSNAKLSKGAIRQPYVAGAVIDLGLCFNLMEANALSELRDAFDYLDVVYDMVFDEPMPRNMGTNMGARFRDKAVIEATHQIRKRRKLQPYDSVRSALTEGEPVYPDSGFMMKNHIQIAVRNPAGIKGYFRLPGL